MGQEKGSGVLGHLEVDFHTKGENELLELFVSCTLQELSVSHITHTSLRNNSWNIRLVNAALYIILYYAFTS